MKMQYFSDIDTVYIEFSSKDVIGTKELDENTLIDLDQQGIMVAITMEHASEQADLSHISVSGIAA